MTKKQKHAIARTSRRVAADVAKAMRMSGLNQPDDIFGEFVPCPCCGTQWLKGQDRCEMCNWTHHELRGRNP